MRYKKLGYFQSQLNVQLNVIMREIAYQSKGGFKLVIECHIYCLNKWETKSEIVYQSKIRFECVIKCQTYCVNEFEIVHQSKIRFECVI